jgi:SAM-dependent methyltransferase
MAHRDHDRSWLPPSCRRRERGVSDYNSAMNHDPHDAAATDEELWNERYRSSTHVWSGNPNPQLLTEVAALPPGRALDVGCGEGADAIWLAQQGWDVVAIDISSVALARAERHSRETDPHAAHRIEWRQSDLVRHTPEPDAYDLVSAQFMQLPVRSRTELFDGLFASVRVGGTLLVVGHDPSDVDTGVRRPRRDVLYGAGEIAERLPPDAWRVEVNEIRSRPATTPDGADVTIHDAVLRAVRVR